MKRGPGVFALKNIRNGFWRRWWPNFKWEKGICTTLAPAGDDVLVLGHVENTQTIQNFHSAIQFLLRFLYR